MATPSAEELFDRYRPELYRFLARATGSADLAEDLSQEVFLRVVRALNDGWPVGHERGWLFSIAHHLLIDRHRSNGRSPARGAAPEREPSRPATQDLAAVVSDSVDRLPDTDRQVFLLREISGLTYEEIAIACGCTVEAVRARLRRVRCALREDLAPSLWE